MHLDELLHDDGALDRALGLLPAARPRASAAAILDLARSGAAGAAPGSVDDIPQLTARGSRWLTWTSRAAAVLVLGGVAAAGWTALDPARGGGSPPAVAVAGVASRGRHGGLQADLDHALALGDRVATALLEIDTAGGRTPSGRDAGTPGRAVASAPVGRGAVPPPASATDHMAPWAGADDHRDPPPPRDGQLVLAVAGVDSSPAGSSTTFLPSPVTRLAAGTSLDDGDVSAVDLPPTRLRVGGSLSARRGGARGLDAGPGLALGVVHVARSGHRVAPAVGAGIDVGLLAAADDLLPRRTGGVHLDAGIRVDGGRAEVQLGWSVGGRLTAPPAAGAAGDEDAAAAVAQIVTGPSLGVTIPVGDRVGLHLDATVQGGLLPRDGAPPRVQPWFGLVAGVEIGLPRAG